MSPVIGVILMVAITVILAAVIGTFVLDLGQSAGNSAPSPSLSVSAKDGTNNMTISHKGGDGLDSSQTRIVVTNETGEVSETFEPTDDSIVLSVGGFADVWINSTGEAVDWNGDGTVDYPDDGQDIDEISSGSQYCIQLIDTESQRVIYETTVTA